jgi:hypothetical protein
MDVEFAVSPRMFVEIRLLTGTKPPPASLSATSESPNMT